MRLCMLLLAVFLASDPAGADDPPVETVPSVDLERYAGKWYEIARLPNRFQRDCIGATAEYAVRDDGAVDVVNTCFEANGSTRSIKGKAVPREGSDNSKLRVQFDGFFFKLFSWLIKADYWVLELAEDYSYAVVGTPNRDNLWILSRERTMDEATYEELLSRAAAQGFETSQIVRTAVPAST